MIVRRRSRSIDRLMWLHMSTLACVPFKIMASCSWFGDRVSDKYALHVIIAGGLRSPTSKEDTGRHYKDRTQRKVQGTINTTDGD